MELNYRAATVSPPLVALLAWTMPGVGYLLLGQRGRAMGVGITIITLFVLGLLIGGVRVMEVPGFDTNTGKKVIYPVIDPQTGRLVDRQWVLAVAPLAEVRDKPWSVPQIMTGPIAIVAGAWSVYAAGPDAKAPGGTIGVLTHSRINEIGSLYLSVAGLLNLMAIIDSTWRATRMELPAGKVPA